MYLSFVEHHRLKCRVNDLVQNYDKNPKTSQELQDLTQRKIRVTARIQQASAKFRNAFVKVPLCC